MMIAPLADTGDGLIEYRALGTDRAARPDRAISPRSMTASHIRHPLAESRHRGRVEFSLDGPVDVMVDGEVLTLHCETLEVLPSALHVMV